MDRDERNRLTDTYYRAADEENYDLFDSVFTDDVTYLYPDEDDMHGLRAVREFFEQRRQTTNTTHDLFRRVYDDEATICEGHITGELHGEGPFEGAFVGSFEFDDEAGAIDRVGVYTRL